MSEPVPVDLRFREAALASKLVSEKQWRAAALEVKNARKQDGRSVAVTDEQREHVTAAIAANLIRDGVLTPYQSQQLQAGRTKLTLGPYLVTEFLGQGGMGQVFGGVHEIMGRHCAIKVLPLDKSDDVARECFLREIRLQASLDCPYLVRAFDAGREGNVHFLVTEYVPGTDLRRLVKQNGPLSVQQTASIIAQAAAGLAYAHESGLIHRDIKPANILVTPDGHAKVADVGLAALAFGGDDDADTEKDPRAGKVVGTADYLSPEQIRTPHLVGPQSDLYSLGCTMYYCVTGKVPFPGGDSRSKCKRHLSETPWHPTRFTPDLPAEFVNILADMMEKDTRQRIQSAGEVVQRLSVYAASTHDEGEEWLAELGVEINMPPATDRSTDRLLGSAGMRKRLVPISAKRFPNWKTTSSGLSESASAVSEGDESAGSSHVPTLGQILGHPPDRANDHSPSSIHTDADVHRTVPPPITRHRRLFSFATLFIAVVVASFIGAVIGWLVAIR